MPLWGVEFDFLTPTLIIILMLEDAKTSHAFKCLLLLPFAVFALKGLHFIEYFYIYITLISAIETFFCVQSNLLITFIVNLKILLFFYLVQFHIIV